MNNAKAKFKAHRRRCNDANPKLDALGTRVEFKMTFGQWYDIWDESGRWADRGTFAGQYVMARHNDIGHYEVGNVSIILSVENTRQASIGRTFKHTDEAKRKISEAGQNRVVTAETREKMRQASLGQVCSEETKLKLSKLNKGKKMKRVACKCGLETSPQNLSRHQRHCVQCKPVVGL